MNRDHSSLAFTLEFMFQYFIIKHYAQHILWKDNIILKMCYSERKQWFSLCSPPSLCFRQLVWLPLSDTEGVWKEHERCHCHLVKKNPDSFYISGYIKLKTSLYIMKTVKPVDLFCGICCKMTDFVILKFFFKFSIRLLKIRNASRMCMSSLHRAHANLWIAPLLV